MSEDMAIKLIALDLDGTLLTSKKTIDEETKKRLLEVQKMGISIAIATGRDKGGIDFVSKPLHLEEGKNFVAGVNGQIIYDFAKKEYYVDGVLGQKMRKTLCVWERNTILKLLVVVAMITMISSAKS